ncbi:MAG: sulfite exporter TauE/SafE family protein [Candidatus Sericytochromatia bacterium]
MSYILGYISAILMGGVLGLIGGGGSILTVPILVYLFKIPPVLATAYSLFIVGLTSLFAVIGYVKKNLVNFKVGIIFSIPSFIGVFSSRKFIVPAIPKELLHIGNYTLNKDTGILFLFALMMVAASISMIKKKKENSEPPKEISEAKKLAFVSLEGLIVGILTGLIGAGGGFLVIPVLVMFAKMEMKEAVATSLLVITIKSLFGFLGDLGNNSIDWSFLGGFSVFTIAGAFIGTYLSKFVPSEKLKPAFGWFVLVMGIFILLKEGLGSH